MRNILSRYTIFLNHCFKKSTRYGSSSSVSLQKAISEAERVTGYSPSYIGLKYLLSDEMSNVIPQLRKVVGTGHPIVQITKELLKTDHGSMQLRGLVVLLVSKMAGTKDSSGSMDPELVSLISSKQKSLAEIIELMHTAHLLQEGILDLKSSESSSMQFGNKMAVLSADLLLANACLSLASLENLTVMTLINSSLADMAEGEFQKTSEVLNKVIGLDDWLRVNSLIAGSLLGKSCQGAVQLSNHPYSIQKAVFEFGKLLGLAWQGYQEINDLSNLGMHSMSFKYPLYSLPVVMAVQNSPDIATDLTKTKDPVKIIEIVKEANGFSHAKDVSDGHAADAFACLNIFDDDSDAKSALKRIIFS